MGEENGLLIVPTSRDEVNTAARIASKAAAGEILVSENALARAGIDGKDLESRRLALKGISKPVTVRVMYT